LEHGCLQPFSVVQKWRYRHIWMIEYTMAGEGRRSMQKD
jgi:hypothetical protein